MSLLNGYVFGFLILAFLSLRIVKEYDRWVIFFLGKVTGGARAGIDYFDSDSGANDQSHLAPHYHEYPLAKNYHQRQCVYRHCCGGLI